MLAFLIVGVPAGVIAWGFNSVINLSGQRLSALHALFLTLASLALYTAPFLAVASFGLFLSVVTRHSVAAVVGTLLYTVALQGLSGVPAIAWIRPYLIVNSSLPGTDSSTRPPSGRCSPGACGCRRCLRSRRWSPRGLSSVAAISTPSGQPLVQGAVIRWVGGIGRWRSCRCLRGRP